MIDSASSTELGEPMVAQPLFAPSGPARRPPLGPRIREHWAWRAWAPLYRRQHGRVDPSRHPPPRPHGVENIELRSRTRPAPCRTPAAAEAVLARSAGHAMAGRPLEAHEGRTFARWPRAPALRKVGMLVGEATTSENGSMNKRTLRFSTNGQ